MIKLIGSFLFGFALLAVTMIGCSYISTASFIASAPARVATHTFSTENIINSYDGFYAMKSAIDSRIQSIELYKMQAQDEPDLSEQRTMKSNLLAMRTVCIQTVEKYNNNAAKLTSGLFKGWELPQTIDAGTCQQ